MTYNKGQAIYTLRGPGKRRQCLHQRFYNIVEVENQEVIELIKSRATEMIRDKKKSDKRQDALELIKSRGLQVQRENIITMNEKTSIVPL